MCPKNFWCITTLFNPAKYQVFVNNYNIFSEKLQKQNVNLLAIELAFGDEEFQLHGENVLHLRGNSIMWQKERLVNYGLSQLPPNCEYFAWLDCDIIFPDNWVELTIQKLQKSNIIQLFKKIIYLPSGVTEYNNEKFMSVQGIIWQKMIHKNWLERRKKKDLPFSSPGFAWAAKKDVFYDIGIYDKNIIGSGDTFLVDCYFDSWDIHGYAQKFNNFMKKDMMLWNNELRKKELTFDYLPVDIYHLWHGNLRNRKYMERHDIVLKHQYDPEKDIKLENNVYEWVTDKKEMHEEIKSYFYSRNDDETNK